jgi:hypothetical protein
MSLQNYQNGHELQIAWNKFQNETAGAYEFGIVSNYDINPNDPGDEAEVTRIVEEDYEGGRADHERQRVLA